MAIDMSTVKQINYNNKEIKKIEMNGNVVWQKPQQRRQVTATVSWNQSQLANNAVFTYDGNTNFMTKITWKTEAQVNSAIATKLGINVDDIISKSNYSLTTRWGASASGNILYFKKSNSTSGANWWSYTTTASGQVYPKITATPTWGATVYGAFKINSSSSVSMITTSSAVKLRSVQQTGWAFSCSVTYWEYY